MNRSHWLPLSPTLSFKIDTELKKQELNEWFNKLAKNRGEKKGDSLAHIVQQYELGFKELKGTTPSSVRLIEQIECPFLKYEERDFKCFEKFDAKKKPDLLGDNPDKILLRCEACKQGKAQAILQQYQKKLRGQNIRGIVSMIRTFETFAEKGVPSTIYFCNRIKGKQVVTGKNQITCTKHDSRVPINPTCIDPRCPHFSEYTITVEHEFPKEALYLIENIVEDYQRIEDLTGNKKKEVEVEQE